MRKEKICAWCHYARMRKDICGTYCTGGFANPDGTCTRFKDSRTKKTPALKKVEAKNKT